MVDWIDGNLSEAEIAKLAEASGRGDIRQRVQQLQRNRSLLASVRVEAPPADLHDRVLAALERDSLIGVSAEQWAQVEDSARPIATLPQDRFANESQQSVSRNWWNAAPSLAMAASILLLVGGGVLLYPTIRSAMSPAPLVPNTLPGNGSLASNSGTGNVGDAQSMSGTVAAMPGATANDAGPAGSALATAGVGAPSAQSTQPAQPIDMARALELAREGRLIVRVIAKDTASLARVETAATNPQSKLGWRLSRDVPSSVVAMMMPPVAGEPMMASASVRDRTASLLGAFAGPGAALSLPNPQQIAQNKVRGTYVLDVQQSSAGFSQALDMMSKGLSATIQFEQSAEPMPLHRGVKPSDVMWWNHPSNQWTDRVAVPVIVQRG